MSTLSHDRSLPLTAKASNRLATPSATRHPSSRVAGAAAHHTALVALSSRTADALATTFRVLGDATRVKMLVALSGGERSVGALADVVGMSESAVSHQLRVLRDARIVKARRAGRLVYYSLDDHHVQSLVAQALQHVAEPHQEPPSCR
jgi:DNA-binding transcriptional ArsR family regulator